MKNFGLAAMMLLAACIATHPAVPHPAASPIGDPGGYQPPHSCREAIELYEAAHRQLASRCSQLEAGPGYAFVDAFSCRLAADGRMDEAIEAQQRLCSDGACLEARQARQQAEKAWGQCLRRFRLNSQAHERASCRDEREVGVATKRLEQRRECTDDYVD